MCLEEEVLVTLMPCRVSMSPLPQGTSSCSRLSSTSARYVSCRNRKNRFAAARKVLHGASVEGGVGKSACSNATSDSGCLSML